jgi:hypothetical protein
VLHKRILIPLIDQLDEDTAAYFGRVVDHLEKDPRLEDYPNMPFLVLRETIFELPVYLEPKEVVDLLFSYVIHNVENLKTVLHSKEYLHDHSALRAHCTAFVIAVVRDSMKEVDMAYEDRNRQSEYRLSWPIDPKLFPYVDDEDEDD